MISRIVTWVVLAVSLSCAGAALAEAKEKPSTQIQLGPGDRILGNHAGGSGALAFSPDGKWLASAGDDRSIRLWDLETDKEVRRFEGHLSFIRTLRFSPNGKLLASAGDDPGAVLWDPGTGKEVRRVGRHTNGFRQVSFSPDSKTLATSGFDGNIGLWDTDSGKQLHYFYAHPRVPYGFAFSPDGKTLASGGDNEGLIRLWDVATAKQVRCWEAHDTCVYSVAFSPDGRLLASGGGDTTARLWEVATGKLVRRLEGHFQSTGKVAFAPDGRTLVSASHEKTVHLWETMTGREIRRFGNHSGWVWDVAYSPTGRSVASAGRDGSVVVWNLGSTAVDQHPGTMELTATELDAAWRELAGVDAALAFTAALRLSAAPPRQVVPYVRERLRPAPGIDAEVLERLVRDMDDNAFDVRQRASRKLEALGHQAGPAIRKALQNSPSLEASRRLEALLGKLSAGDIAAERLQALRALRVLEALDTPESRLRLKELAGGAPGDLLTQEADACLARLTGRAAAAP